MPRTNDPLFRGTIYLQTSKAGWSENYYLNTNIRASAVTFLTEIVDARRKCLPSSIEIPYARVSRVGDARDGLMVEAAIGHGWFGQDLVIGGGVTQTDVDGRQKCDYPNTALLFRHEGAQGAWLMRHYRGLPDYFVTDAKASAAFDPVFSTVPVDAGDGYLLGNNFVAHFRHYLWKCANRTILITSELDPQGFFDFQNTAKINYRKVSSRKCGRPFDTYRGRAAMS